MNANSESCQNLPFVAMGLVLCMVVMACEDAPVGPNMTPVGYGRAYDRWTPGPGECSAEIHNAYSVIGPDGKLYPTWHPPVDPATGCSFGHEHGRDPRGSALYRDVGPIPFGYANDQLDIFDPLGARHEDHVGHKIEWENGVQLDFNGVGQVLDIRCDVLTKLHQGSHSKDAFTNNLHELVYAIRCTDQTAMRITIMAAIGTPGEMVASCDRNRRILVGPPTPLNSPDGGGKRAIPDRLCIEQHMLVGAGTSSNYDAALRESWEVHFNIRRADGRTLASADPYYQVLFPSRYYDSSLPDGVARPMAACYEQLPGGQKARGGLCQSATAGGAVHDIRHDDPRSPFNGVRRFVDINGNRVSNADGPETWYTDPFGRNARTEPFPGSIRQYISRTDNGGRAGHGPVIGRQRDYGGAGVRAPN
jgi:hypothetical protein